MPDPYNLVLEFSRSEHAGQPHAFRFAPQAYLLRTPGGGFESAEFPWTPELLGDLAAARAPGRSPDTIHRIGETLRGFLAAAGWSQHEHAIVRAAREGAPIFITIRSAAAELYALPWEFVALKSTGQLLGGIPGLLVRYEWPETSTFPDRAVAPRRGRVLFAWSAAGGAVPASEHLAALKTALAAHPGAFDPERDVLAHATYGRLAQALADAERHGPPIDALHLLCHGAALGGSYGLALDDEANPGTAVVVDAGRMQQLLAAHADMVRMVVLAACDSANTGEPGNHLGSVAQMIHRAGLQAMLASRYPLSAAGSTRFTAALFGALAHDSTLESAFIAARDALLRDPAQLDWASVQLYSRHADGHATLPLGLVPRPAPVQVPVVVAEAPAPVPPASPRWPLVVGLTGGLLALALVVLFILDNEYGAGEADTDPTTAAPPEQPPAVPKPAVPKPADPKPEPHLNAPPKVPGDEEPATPLEGPDKAQSKTTPSGPSTSPAPPLDKRPGPCPRAVEDYLGNFLKDDPEGDPVELTIVVSADGKLAVDTDRALASDESTGPLRRAKADTLVTKGARQLPCKLRLTWLP